MSRSMARFSNTLTMFVGCSGCVVCVVCRWLWIEVGGDKDAMFTYYPSCSGFRAKKTETLMTSWSRLDKT